MGSGGVQADALARAMKEVGLAERLALASRAINGRLVFTTSFGLEDQAITHAIFRAGLDIHIELVTLDTGRLFPETYDLWAQTEERYGRRINAVSPDRSDLEALVARQGVNGFRHSVEARKACCDIRKVEPLGRALAGAAGWVTGLRAEQSAFRAAVPLALQDEVYRLIKLNPLADWSRQDLVRYVTDNAVPYNPLHDQGYPSIGCAPCTRAVRLGEPERAGRWWWEQEAKKECGLHLVPTQRIQEHSHDRRA
ncbi:phosphoadenylyl-sulfate reductase [Microvirga sp. HBU67558]|uniref:phosphoadenylyl-sulfate reductase n=1 Tax=Microvirga TaxID=186650 RepID=UPI001B35BB1D|nr:MULTISPECIES: phosphoadenylyl-sulfate reductase [unclassified Microvirga]MBQ0822714.1 phosphoadenylyl-sulfate reductase [Microvirga sp. HBU67558]